MCLKVDAGESRFQNDLPSVECSESSTKRENRDQVIEKVI